MKVTNQEELDKAWLYLQVHHDDLEKVADIEQAIQDYVDEKNRINRLKYLQNER